MRNLVCFTFVILLLSVSTAARRLQDITGDMPPILEGDTVLYVADNADFCPPGFCLRSQKCCPLSDQDWKCVHTTEQCPLEAKKHKKGKKIFEETSDNEQDP